MDINTHTCDNYLLICKNLNCNRNDSSLCSQYAPMYNFIYYELEIIYASITIYIYIYIYILGKKLHKFPLT